MTAQPMQRIARKPRRSHPGIPHLVVDGYGVRLSVRHGRLVIEDGMGAHRQRRELSRIERTIRRIVILTDTGTVSLEAIRWCADVGIAVVQLDRDGRPLLSATAPGTDDARLRRAQAAASSSPLGLQITRDLLGAKLAGQAAVARDLLDNEPVAEQLDNMAAQMETSETLSACRDLEAQGAQMYFGAWPASVHCRFAEQERPKVPEHWTSFNTRRTVIAHTATTHPAATPINAMLNYSYGLAEIECRLAAITVGLDPGMGIVHTDKKNRDSLALDLLEAIRPLVERNVLTLLATRHFVAGDFHETRDGNCRLVSPLTHLLVDAMPGYATAIAPITEALAHDLARSSPGRIELSTRLTRANITNTRISGTRLTSGEPKPSAASMLTCRSCGIPLSGEARKLCPSCLPLARNAGFLAMREANIAVRAAARKAGVDPTRSPEALAKRRQSALVVKAAEAAWVTAGSYNPVSEAQLQEEVLPRLQQVSVRQIQDATGLSSTACSMIRRCKRAAHPRHWAALAELASSLPGS